MYGHLPFETYKQVLFSPWRALTNAVLHCVYVCVQESIVHVYIWLLYQTFISFCYLYFCLSVFCVRHRVRSRFENEKAYAEFFKSHCAYVCVCVGYVIQSTMVRKSELFIKSWLRGYFVLFFFFHFSVLL